MCDYSLHNVASRPARVGDQLISARFSSSLTRGFADPKEPDVAVCIRPGTEVAFERDAEAQGRFNLIWNRNVRQKVARFRKVDPDQPDRHHDALEFPDGQVVLVADLVEGQHVTVLQLPAAPRAEYEVKDSALATVR